ncbi:Putative fluoride ion transporter CrcB [Ceraceosorus bombacis]|uniref:Putative fluoride ion transporter CrcB n=1 Tax=Ceraceosorus bombacis TaxID=401625 RepID=A0A0P1BMA4_9BASI|nr:Putative fluoride ion transporter CrcB [Ceraceosorus bombacis]
MGWAMSNKKSIDDLYPPLYTAITTGLCGCITTFSVWVLECFRAYGDQYHHGRSGFYNAMDGLTQTIATLAVSLACLSAGHHFANFLPFSLLLRVLDPRRSAHTSSDVHLDTVRQNASTDFRSEEASSGTQTQVRNASSGQQREHKGVAGHDSEDVLREAPFTHGGPARAFVSRQGPRGVGDQSRVLDFSCFVLGLAFWIGSALLCAFYAPWRRITFSLVMSPPGCVLRWYLSFFNPLPASHSSKLSLGTLAANLVATLFVGTAFVLQHVGRAAGSAGGGAYSMTGCAAAYGLEEGFCGCLSTISTFAAELRAAKGRSAVWYAAVSYIAGIAICVLIIGSPWWSLGMDGSCVGLYPVG